MDDIVSTGKTIRCTCMYLPKVQLENVSYQHADIMDCPFARQAKAAMRLVIDPVSCANSQVL